MNAKKSANFYLLSLIVIFLFTGCIKDRPGTGFPVINAANDKITGASARDLLSQNNFASLKIEVQYMTGYAPDAPSLNNLTAFLNSILNKPGGITITQKEIAPEAKSSYTTNDIATLEQKERTAYNSGNQLDAYVIITDGNYTNPAALGLSYRNTSICLLGKTIFDNSGGIGQVSRTKLEATVLEHEFGHLLGLVDLGTPMVSNHKDAANGNHCNVQSCLMYYAVETTDFLGFAGAGNVPVLDSQCLADLHANGGK